MRIENTYANDVGNMRVRLQSIADRFGSIDKLMGWRFIYYQVLYCIQLKLIAKCLTLLIAYPICKLEIIIMEMYLLIFVEGKF